MLNALYNQKIQKKKEKYTGYDNISQHHRLTTKVFTQRMGINLPTYVPKHLYETFMSKMLMKLTIAVVY